MLEFVIPNNNPITRECVTCFLFTGSVKLPPVIQEKDFCFCESVGCEDQYMYAFTGNNDYESDKFSLFSQILIDHTVSFFLVDKKNNDFIIELVDGVHGTFNDFDESTKQFIVDWKKVSDIFGHGLYDLKVVQNYVQQDFVTDYKTFMVMPFDAQTAHGTIRLTTYINGEIENFADFKNYNVFSQIRLNGRVNLTTISNELETTPNISRRQLQAHDREFNEYDVVIRNIEEQYLRLLINQYLMSDIIEVNDYNLFNLDFRNLRLRKQSLEPKNTLKFRTVLTMKAVDYVQGRVKRT